MDQAEDFRTESKAIEELLKPFTDEDFNRATAFKGWTVNQILRHLHVWNNAAMLSLQDEAAFNDYLASVMSAFSSGSLTDFEARYLNNLNGRALFDEWRSFFHQVADAFAASDPSQRVPWAGPSMSARSSITARLMESWAHAQAIYDAFGVDRDYLDSIKNIVVLGYNTYNWTFKNRQLAPPEPRPSLVLTAPSGAVWTYGEPESEEHIKGDAAEFCQVVTQTRNIADTQLIVTGANAKQWMGIAQCFAGGPVDPPPPGERRKKD